MTPLFVGRSRDLRPPPPGGSAGPLTGPPSTEGRRTPLSNTYLAGELHFVGDRASEARDIATAPRSDRHGTYMNTFNARKFQMLRDKIFEAKAGVHGSFGKRGGALGIKQAGAAF